MSTQNKVLLVTHSFSTHLNNITISHLRASKPQYTTTTPIGMQHTTMYDWIVRVRSWTVQTHCGPSGYACAKHSVARQAQFSYSPQRHYSTPHAAHRSHNMSSLAHEAEYFLVHRMLERFTTYHTIVGCGTIMPREPIPDVTFDRSSVEGRHQDNQPPEPHVPRTNGLPSTAMDEVREEITKQF
jgi:hypothetical protein